MMVKKVVKIFSILILVGILIPSTIFAVTGTVIGNSVRIRKEADSKSIEVSLATKGEKVEIIGEKGNWYNVKFENVTGYISKEYVSTNNTNTQSNNISNNVYNNTTNNSSNDNKDNSNSISNTVSNTIQNNNESLSTDNNTVQENVPNSVENSNEENNLESNSTDNNETYSSVDSKKYEKNQTINLKQDADLKYLPNFTSRVQATAKKDSTYTVVAILNNWIKISNEDNSGWILVNNIDEEITENESTNLPKENQTINETSSSNNNTSKGIVNVSSAVIRKLPNGEKIDSLAEGTEVTILSEENDWYKIKTKDYESCYIAKRLITKK